MSIFRILGLGAFYLSLSLTSYGQSNGCYDQQLIGHLATFSHVKPVVSHGNIFFVTNHPTMMGSQAVAVHNIAANQQATLSTGFTQTLLYDWENLKVEIYNLAATKAGLIVHARIGYREVIEIFLADRPVNNTFGDPTFGPSSQYTSLGWSHKRVQIENMMQVIIPTFSHVAIISEPSGSGEKIHLAYLKVWGSQAPSLKFQTVTINHSPGWGVSWAQPPNPPSLTAMPAFPTFGFGKFALKIAFQPDLRVYYEIPEFGTFRSITRNMSPPSSPLGTIDDPVLNMLPLNGNGWVVEEKAHDLLDVNPEGLMLMKFSEPQFGMPTALSEYENQASVLFPGILGTSTLAFPFFDATPVVPYWTPPNPQMPHAEIKSGAITENWDDLTQNHYVAIGAENDRQPLALQPSIIMTKLGSGSPNPADYIVAATVGEFPDLDGSDMVYVLEHQGMKGVFRQKCHIW